ncbi:MAG: hypothetical protein AAF798_10335 [Bacteroidota bacterium]
MKRFFLTTTFLCLGCLAFAQSLDLPTFNENRLERQRTSMLILGSWAIGNIAVGATLAGQRQGVEREFHIMNAGWNAVNLVLAGVGYYTAVKTDPSSFDLYQSIQEQQSIEKVLLFNAGLDVGYMLGGLYLMERGKSATKNADRLEGFGKSILLQGAFLFVFDLGAYFYIHSNAKDLEPLLSSLTISGNEIGVVWHF